MTRPRLTVGDLRLICRALEMLRWSADGDLLKRVDGTYDKVRTILDSKTGGKG